MNNWHQIETPTQMNLLIGFFDLNRYAKYCVDRSALEILAMMQAFFEATGKIIAEENGVLVKAIGDAGLAAFPVIDTEQALSALRCVKHEGEALLRARGFDTRIAVKLNSGNVACGLVGAPGRQHFDVYGDVVNQAAMLPATGFCITSMVQQNLSPEARRLFKTTKVQGVFTSIEDNDCS